MTIPLLWWIAAAVLLFWSVGAYNRLVRTRAQVNAAFAVLDGHWVVQMALVESNLPASMRQAQPLHTFARVDEATELWAGLRAAATQFSASLSAMRVRPLNPETAAALAAGQDVLVMAWHRVLHEAPDLAGSPMPDSLALAWDQQMQETRKAQTRFNQDVAAYNTAISQFPAILLAWLFGFKPARGL